MAVSMDGWTAGWIEVWLDGGHGGGSETMEERGRVRGFALYRKV